MLPTIDLLEKGQEIRIQICNSRMKVIGSVKEADAKSYDINTGKLNELSFIIPLYIDSPPNGLQKNKNADLLVNRCILKVQYGTLEEYFIIDNYDDSDDSQYRQIHAFSLGNQLNDKLIKSYKSQTLVTTTDPSTNQTTTTLTDAPIDITTAITDALQYNRSWSVGYIDPAFNGLFRYFEFDSQTGLEYVYQIGTAFNAIITWDTKNKKVNAYHPDLYGTDKGFKITDEKYISNLVKKTSDDEFCTRLYLYGKDGITINSVSPLGQSYIEDFSYFMNNGMMSQELIASLTTYNNYVVSRQSEFPSLLTQLNSKQSEMSTLQLDMSTLKNNRLIAQDRLDEQKATDDFRYYTTSVTGVTLQNIGTLMSPEDNESDYVVFYSFNHTGGTDKSFLYHDNGDKISVSNQWGVAKCNSNYNLTIEVLDNYQVNVTLVYMRITDDTDFANLTSQQMNEKYNPYHIDNMISAKQTEINNKQSEIDQIYAQIKQLQTDLSVESHLSEDDLNELDSFIITKEYTDENILNAEDLLEAGKEQLKERNIPQVLYDVSLVNFLGCLEEKRNWDKISIFDIVRIQSKKLNVDIKARIVNIKVDKDTINLTIANSKNVKDEPDKFIQLLYGTVNGTKTLQRKEGTWDDASKVRDEFNSYLNGEIDAVKQMIVAGINENIQIYERGIKITSPDDINTFLIINHGVIAITKDGGNSWQNALTTSGVVAERLFGKVLAGNNLTITNEKGTFVVDGGNVIIDGGSEKAKIIINPTDGVRIKTSPDNGQTWVETFFVDTDGILHARGMIISNQDGTSVLIDAKNKTIDFSNFDIIIGKLKAENITVGSGSTFEEGYDPIAMVFGGRNYLLNSNFERNLYFWEVSGATIDTDASTGKCIKIDGALNTNKYIKQSINASIFTEFSKADKFYVGAKTKIFNYVAGTNPYIKMKVEINYTGISTVTTIDYDIPLSEWQRISFLVTKPSEIINDISSIDFYVYGNDFTGQLFVDEIMFEIGSKPTSWQPAPEDVNNQLYEQILTNYKKQLATSKAEIDAKYNQLPQPTTSLKVATWNIRATRNRANVYYDVAKQMKPLLQAQSFDLLGLQEVQVNYSAQITKYPQAAITPGVFYAARFYEARKFGAPEVNASFGDGLMSKTYGINNVNKVNLPNNGYENNVFTQSDFILNGRKINVFVTHFHYQDDALRVQQMQFIKSKFDALNGEPFICFGDFNVRSTNEFNILLPTYQVVNGHNGQYFDTYAFDDWDTKRIDNIICSNHFTISSKGMVTTDLSDHNILWATLTVPNTVQQKKADFDAKYNDLITTIDTALADGTATETEKANVDAKIELYKAAISDLGISYQLSIQEIYDIDYQQNNGNLSELIESGIRGDMRLDAPLPSFITMDQNGITATTTDPNKFARMDYRGFYAKQGAFSLERPDGGLMIDNGIATFDFGIDAHEPPFMEAGISVSGSWYKGNNFNWASCNYYNYKHTGRYLKMLLGVSVDSGGTGWVRIMESATVKLWEYSHQLTGNNNTVTVTVDLGVPTYQAKQFYLQLSTSDTSKTAYVRVLRKWLEG